MTAGRVLASEASADALARTEALRAAQERFQLAFNHAPVGMMLLDASGAIVDANEAAEHLLGRDRAEILRLGRRGLIHPDDHVESAVNVGALISVGTTAVIERRVVHADGHILCVRVHSKVIAGPDGQTLVIVDLVDITEQRRAEEALANSEKRFRLLAENSADVIVTFGLDGVCRYASPASTRVLGYSPEELVGSKGQLLVHKDDVARLYQEMQVFLAGDETHVNVGRFVAKDGRSVWIEAVSRGVRDAATGELEEIQASWRDVTERVEQAAALEQAKARFEAAFAHAPVGITLADAQGRTLAANEAMSHMLGRTRDELVGTRMEDVVHPDDLADPDELSEAAASSAVVSERELRLVHADGHIVWVRVSAAGLPGSSNLLIVHVEDVTDRKVAELALIDAEDRFRHAFDDAPIGMSLVDNDGRYIRVNDALCRIAGQSPEEMLGAGFEDLTHPDDRALSVLHMASLRQGGEQQSCFEKRCVRRDGETVWVRVNASVVVDRSGQPLYSVAQIEDLSEREAAEAALRVSNARFAAFVEHSSDMTTVLTREGAVLYASPAASLLWNLPTVLPAMADTRRLVHPDDLATLGSAFAASVAGDSSVCPVWRARHEDGTWRHFESLFTNLLADPAVGGIVVNTREVTERVQAAALLAHQAFHDSLTGLPNRTLLSDRLSQALRRSQRSGRPTALLFLDVDRFKVINDSLGHAAGDEMLRHVAKRLETVVRPEDTVARVGGDEFVVIAEVNDTNEPMILARRIITAFLDPIPLPGGEDTIMTVSIGVALSTEHDPDGLLRDADTALYRAKESGRDRYELFDDELRDRAVRRHTTEQRLRRALDEDRFALGYQPIINLQSGKVVKVEALLRVDLGEPLVEVSDMIRVAEDSGLIVALGVRVLNEACRRAAGWQERLGAAAPGTVSVNVAARQLSSTMFVEQVEAALDGAGLAADRLCLELTEGTLIEAGRSTVNTLEELKALGVSLAIDDFGTGYSSLSYLKRFPLDYLKIDRSFVDGLGTDPGDTAIVRALIGLGRALSLITVAEGVETEGQLVALRDLGCDLAQGFWFSPALSDQNLVALLHENWTW